MPIDLRPRDPESGPWCIHHGTACGMGKRPFDELYLMIHDAKVAVGEVVPPLDQHQRATAAQRAAAEKELAALIAQKHAENEREIAHLRGETDTLEDW